jgi:hypothetical protein
MPLRRGASPRFKIKNLSEQLRKLSFPESPISIDLARFAANAFDNFLSGKCNSLDEAFEVEKGRGAPRKLSTARKHMALAKKIADLRLAGKTLYQIEDELGMDGGAIRRLYKPFRARVLSRKIDLGLSRRAKDDPTPRKNELQVTEEERWAAWKKQNDKDWATYLGSKDHIVNSALKRPKAKKK